MNAKDQDLIVTRRQLSLIVAGTIFILFFMFMLGYHFGMQHTTDMYDSMYQNVPKGTSHKVTVAQTENTETLEKVDFQQGVEITEATEVKEIIEQPVILSQQEEASAYASLRRDGSLGSINQGGPIMHSLERSLGSGATAGLSRQNEVTAEYAAELIGFGTEKAAQQFIDRVTKREQIALELRTRSYMRGGKSTPWYQVVTQRYKTKKELDTVITAITKKEKLHNINIVSC